MTGQFLFREIVFQRGQKWYTGRVVRANSRVMAFEDEEGSKFIFVRASVVNFMSFGLFALGLFIGIIL